MSKATAEALADFLAKRTWWHQRDHERFLAAFKDFAGNKAITGDIVLRILVRLGRIYDEFERVTGTVFLMDLSGEVRNGPESQ